MSGDITYTPISVGHTTHYQPGVVYLGTLCDDGVTPAPLKEGEKYRCMIVGRNMTTSSDTCVIVSKDPVSGTVTHKVVPSPIPEGLYQLTATRVGGEVLVFGGSGPRDTLYSYCIEKDTWRQIGKSGQWPKARFQHSAFCLGGKLYIGGGYHNGYLSDCWRYDPSTERWAQLADAPETFSVAADSVVGDTAHMVGSDNNYTLHLTYTQTKGWTQLSLPFKVYRAAAVSVGTDIYVLGGYDHQDKVG
ncbi:hypothetical protein KIPB_011066 [Kipferlia bialata]|uniref:Uncharacterized protein n=1 Tax=Kipferlia bialata TaxID=797122 RepID=A0A391NZ93_9EUKA|nr:hypothetical protein KIPB_011066 [Kipferlia bialata]|eukprot:g11066.t1